MPLTVAVVLLALAAVLGGIILIRAVKTARANGDWNTATWLILAVAWTPALAKTVASFVAPPTRTLDFSGNSLFIAAGWVSRGEQLATLALAGFALVFVVHQATRRALINPVALVALALFALAVLVTIVSGDPLPTLAVAALGAVLLAATMTRSARGACLGAGVFGVSLAVLSGLLAAVDPATALATCRSDKCGLLGWLHLGAINNENELGLALAMALPFAWLGFRGRHRWLLSGYLLLSVLATGSRTASVAALVVAVLIVVARPMFGSRRGTLATLLVALAGTIVGFALPYQDVSVSEYSGRGLIWAMGQSRLEYAPMFGLGIEDWRLVAFDPGANYSMHNQWLDVRYIAGWAGVALFALLLTMMVARAEHRAATLLVVASMAWIGVAERGWSIGRLDWLSFAFVAAIVAAAPRSARGREPKPAPATHTRRLRSSGTRRSRRPHPLPR